MTLCTKRSTSHACPWALQPNQPDDVLTFSKNHLCVYKELPLLHNTLMHMPASAWIFGSTSILLSVVPFASTSSPSRPRAKPPPKLSPNPLSCTSNNWDKYHPPFILIWLQRRMLFKIDVSATLQRPFLKKNSEMHDACLNCTLRVYSVVHGFSVLAFTLSRLCSYGYPLVIHNQLKLR